MSFEKTIDTIDNYAPVIIPTLNRYEHLKQCLESLEKCTGADKTEVYIGLDYPPSEKYVEGWKKLDAYLTIKEKNHGFKRLIVRRRDHNCGVGNVKLLKKEVIDNYDRYIASEDDNVFAPSFLDFVNKCLKEYENDPQVITVSGYTHPFFYNNNRPLIFTYDNCGWGGGYWKAKELDREKMPKDYYRNMLLSSRISLKLFLNYPVLLSHLISMVNRGVIYGDTMRTCRNILNHTYQVRPYKSLVKNIGYDGSGAHSASTERFFFENQELLEEAVYPFEMQKPEQCVSMFTMWRFSLKPDTLRRIRIILKSFYLYLKFRLNNKKKS